MSTLLYSSPIYGPVKSRRLGISLGVNLMPDNGKCCTFDCVYCECGFNATHVPTHRRPSRDEVKNSLEAWLKKQSEQQLPLDDISFAGNGEPTSHPEFARIVDDTLRLRDKYFPKATVSVMSNATFTGHDDIRSALLRLDNNIQKLDTVNPEYIRRVDRPTSLSYDVEKIVDNLCRFNGEVIIQTMFMKGTAGGMNVDNTGEEYVDPWLEALGRIAPKRVMIYTIDRDTPDRHLEKADPLALDTIRNRVLAMGIPCSVAY